LVAIHRTIVYRDRVELDDRVAITTPEGLTLDMVVAGIGSRFIAGLLDVAIEIGLIVVMSLVWSALDAGAAGAALAIVALFSLLFGYEVLFELFNRGRTPGKAAAGLRVVKLDGRPVDAGSSVIRNLLRLVDGWMLLTAFLFPVGVVAAFASRHTQRLGDLAGGTVVVRDRFVRPRPVSALAPAPAPATTGGDVRGLTADEITVVQRFLDRRATLPPNARIHLAGDLASRIRPRVPGADPRLDDERFLEWIVARRRGGA
jgi:uncharacterized RDD family membrane protein YckC